MKKPKVEQFRQTTPNKLELKKGGGCLGCFGLPFFLAGLFLLLTGVQLIPVSNAAEIPWWGWILLSCMGLVFTTVGGSLVFGRRWVTIDNASGRIWIAWGLLMPMWGKAHDLNDYGRIILSFVAGDSDTADSYLVILKSLTDAELPMLSSQDYGEAYAQALLLRDFVQLPLEDRSSEHALTTKPGDVKQELNAPVFNREIKVVSPPGTLKSDIKLNDSGVTISIPNAKYSPFYLLELLLPLCMALVFGSRVLPFFGHTGTPIQVQMGFGGFVGLFFVLMPLISVLKRYKASKGYVMVVNVDSRGITIKRRKQTKTIAAERIIAIDYGTTDTALYGVVNTRNSWGTGRSSTAYASPWMTRLQRFARAKGVIIKSKDGIFYIGTGLPDDEVVYLYALFKQSLIPC
ncbi:MAG: hypothetical protein CVU50_05945 [Candidatus Cloacimonetes bacterium HGW-Cloacimonetes-3]|jgi:hypothetical protein|nr:MAG: hypothetical protein CVU50_05945 [Candidatus Cloacimonetes bacterium HGW-Cloacimonetes-3]